MGLNIVAKRKYDLSEFAEGWDGAHVIVTVPNAKDRQAYVDFMGQMQEEMNAELEPLTAKHLIKAVAAKYDDIAEKKVTEMAITLIRSGAVVSTNEGDDTSELVQFAKKDVADVVSALGFAWTNDIVATALGNNGLKAKN
ncbi:hypothetical protein [Paeniglutamicibacter sp. NPDC091659]|uniref:hypothetical protein n=1 Tax=Paeniglutamicibacter sp. NPDC091659 TaxID=3364389 RepID=UPI003801385D